LKTKGLSEATVMECLSELSTLQDSPHPRVRAVGEGLPLYLHEEKKNYRIPKRFGIFQQM
jgi:hypothetical protein